MEMITGTARRYLLDLLAEPRLAIGLVTFISVLALRLSM
jgi:hypothetical protein